MVIELGLYALIFLPLAIMIGVASATIGFTAWSIFVPLAFNMFANWEGYTFWDALFISVLVDLVDAAILTVIYSRKGKVDFKQGGIYAVLAVTAGLLAAGFTSGFLEANQNILKGGVGYVVMLIGLGFFLRGRKGLKKQKLTQLENQIGVTTQIGHETGQEFLDKSPKTRKLFSPRMQVILMVIGVALSGLVSGLVGIGSGMNFVLLFMIILGFDTRRATGTGCFIMAILMGAVGCVFVQQVNLVNIWPYLAIAIIFSAVGTLVGAHYVLKISEVKLNFVVGSIVILAATVATVQSILL